jgi:hypothetical protein
VSPLAEQITLDAEEEARRLWQGASDARARAAEDLVALCEVLDLGLRAAEILLIHRLQSVRDKFPATIALQLETPDPALDVMRDAIAEPKAIQFTELLDLLSAEDLECVGPRLHRGWEDRVFSCRRSRTTASEAIGLTLTGPEREQLLLLSAYRNRIFRYPPPTRIRPADVPKEQPR